jgi:hypothetical protein
VEAEDPEARTPLGRRAAAAPQKLARASAVMIMSAICEIWHLQRSTMASPPSPSCAASEARSLALVKVPQSRSAISARTRACTGASSSADNGAGEGGGDDDDDVDDGDDGAAAAADDDDEDDDDVACPSVMPRARTSPARVNITVTDSSMMMITQPTEIIYPPACPRLPGPIVRPRSHHSQPHTTQPPQLTRARCAGRSSAIPHT